MQFYKYEGFITDTEWIEKGYDLRIERSRNRDICAKSRAFNQKTGKKILYFVADVSEDFVSIGIICDDRSFSDKQVKDYLGALKIDLTDASIDEVTFHSVRNMLRSAERNGFIDDYSDILENFELDDLVDGFTWQNDYDEKIVDNASKKKIYYEANRILSGDSLIPELDRIYVGKTQTKAVGHPVHYFVKADEDATRKSICRLLLQALFSKGRIRSRRYTYIEIGLGTGCSMQYYDSLYKCNIGGAIVVRFSVGNVSDDNYAGSEHDVIEKTCKVARNYRNSVLTIFCLDRESGKMRDIFYEYVGNMTFVELQEDLVSGGRARRFLQFLAKENDITVDKKLFEELEDGEEYLASDLMNTFNRWYNEKLKTSIYPQYKRIESAKGKFIKKAKGSAYDELMDLIGLEESKKVINQALDYFKAQRIFADKGMKSEQPTMHMVFTGHPGTAKTTVARLFARIMKENGLLSKGNLIEVGRGDLVGKYVGWTAKIVQDIFRKAMGSVLFIDECYSLVDDRDGLYGDEAINTIVQEMENHRKDVVVIFAGYPDKMEQFLQKNPGLRSRIAFHVKFDDYSSKELCSIAGLIAKQKGLAISEVAYEKLNMIFDKAKKNDDFGNGRYVRNIIERARMSQATRLLSMDLDSLGKKEITTILAEDIEELSVDNHQEKRIGFSA